MLGLDLFDKFDDFEIHIWSDLKITRFYRKTQLFCRIRRTFKVLIFPPINWLIWIGLAIMILHLDLFDEFYRGENHFNITRTKIFNFQRDFWLRITTFLIYFIGISRDFLGVIGPSSFTALRYIILGFCIFRFLQKSSVSSSADFAENSKS